MRVEVATTKSGRLKQDETDDQDTDAGDTCR